MKKILLISILLFPPATANAYSLLHSETHGIRVSLASLLLAEEQPAEPQAEQPAPDTTLEKKSPDLKPGEKQKTTKPLNYWFPIIWDLAPIPALWAWSYKCSTAKGLHEENECSDPLIKATLMGIPLWSIPPTAYVQPPKPMVIAMPVALLIPLLIAFGSYKAAVEREKPSFYCCDTHPVDYECCDEYMFGEKERKEEYVYLVILTSVLQTAEMFFHIMLVKENNNTYKKQQLENQVYIAPYVDKDRAGLACQVSF